MRLLDARRAQVIENHLGEVADFGFGLAVDQFVILVDAQHAMRRQAFYCERSGDAHFGLIFVGLVVEILGIGFGGDGGVDLLLARDALLPPLAVQGFGFGGPAVFGIARDLPLFPLLFQRNLVSEC